MKKELLKKIGVTSALVAAIGPVGVQIATPIVVQASDIQLVDESSNNNFNYVISRIETFEKNGDIEGFYNFLKYELAFESLTDEELKEVFGEQSERKIVSSVIKVVKEVVTKNWSKIVKFLPAWVTLDWVLSAIDTYLGFSDSIEQGLVNVFMAMGLSESTSSFIAKTIMLFMPF